MLKKQFVIAIAATALVASAGAAAAQETVRIGLILSLTGAFGITGQAVVNGAKLYVGDTATSLPGAGFSSSSGTMPPRRIRPSVLPKI
jgi:branched-chain amino acid transport system substrate-binding protein